MNSINGKINILCSGVALGVYIPGISLYYQLTKTGCDVEVFVLENLLPDDIRDKISETKKIFHSNFKLAKIGQKIARDITPGLDQKKIDRLFSQWEGESDTLFILLSGFWLPLFERFGKRSLNESRVIIMHIDSVPSPSWKFLKEKHTGIRTCFLFSHDSQRLNYRLNVSTQSLVPFAQRENRFLLHGGGWGMGTYRNAVDILERRNYMLDIMAYSEDEIHPEKSKNRYFIVDPEWHPWLKNSRNEHIFPPVACVENRRGYQFISRPEYHELFYVGARNKAIISKPGGSTLIDSLASATPLVFLDSFGPHEDFNASLWITLGLGISFTTWEQSDFSDNVLETCHSNLLMAREAPPDFIEVLTGDRKTGIA